jgi:glycosyl transferase family 87
MSRSARTILAIVLVAAAVEGASLVNRGTLGFTDFGVFYRTCLLLRGGAGAELYTRHDVVTDWPISLTPAGLALFQPLAWFRTRAASTGWAVVNFCLVGLSLAALRRVLDSACSGRSDVLFSWAAVLFVLLSAASIQVGQFSVLFATCWILFVSAFAGGSYFSAGILLALPTAIKLYPVMMLAVPLSLVSNAREGVRTLLGFLAGVVIFSAVIPSLMYGSRAWDLNASFWQNVILNPAGQVAYMQTVRASNQSVDALLLRYLTFDKEFHPEEPAMPHLNLPKQEVLPFANLARFIILVITVAAVWRWRSRHPAFRARDVLTMSALWSCTLYLMLPETKARYAVYTFIAFLPLLEVAVNENEPAAARVRAFVEVALCVILIGGLLPDPPKVYGIGLVGAVVLWLRNLRLVRDAAGSGLQTPGFANT